MTTWRVLYDDGDESGDGSHVWVEVGTYETDSAYWIGSGAASHLGNEYGVGEYLLLTDERVQSLVVAQRTEFYEAKAEDNSPPLNAEQIVEQTT